MKVFKCALFVLTKKFELNEDKTYKYEGNARNTLLSGMLE
jgi:hypothetical protein